MQLVLQRIGRRDHPAARHRLVGTGVPPRLEPGVVTGATLVVNRAGFPSGAYDYRSIFACHGCLLWLSYVLATAIMR